MRTRMRTIEIVTHCWRFSRVLNYQLSSLVLYPCRTAEVLNTVFYDPEDRPTVDVLKFFRADTAENRLSVDLVNFFPDGGRFRLQRFPLPRAKLLRREIGRNIAARETAADVVWFCDADYVFGPGCLDALATIRMQERMIYYPRLQQINCTHAIGDTYAVRAARPGIYGITTSDFRDERVRKAIGGLQIVTGDTARRYGYCDGCKLQREVGPGGGWATTVGDMTYRGPSGLDCGNGTPIHLPNLYRIRQSERGVVDTLPTFTDDPVP